MHNKTCNIVIVGGGLVGLSLALQLSCHSDDTLTLCVIERAALPHVMDNPPAYHSHFDARSTALSYGARSILEPLGIWPAVSQHSAPIDSVYITEANRLGSAALKSADVGWSALGYVVENTWLRATLLGELQKKQHVDLWHGMAVQKIVPRRQGIDIECERDGEISRLSAQLVVVSDGAQSRLRTQLGIDTDIQDYPQTALVANVCFTKAHQNSAYECFTDQGPMALLPLPDTQPGDQQKRAALVWVLSTEQANQLIDAQKDAFLSALQHAFGDRQGPFLDVGRRVNFPLQRIMAREQIRSNIVLMGNAAHTLHTVGGQGFNLALRDSARLTELIVAAHGRGENIGALPLLQTYLHKQQHDQDKTTFFLEQLNTLLSYSHPGASVLRRLGLLGLDCLPMIKRPIIYHATGMGYL